MIKRIPRPDEVIVFRKRKEPSFGIFTAGSGAKLSVFSEEGKEVEVDFEKVVLPTGIKLGSELTQSEKKLGLRGIRRDLDEKTGKVDLKTLWEIVSDIEKELTLEELVEIYLGKDESENQRETLLFFWAIEKGDVYFKRGEIGYIPQTPKEVEDIVHRKDQESKKQLERKTALKWARSIVEGREENGTEAGDFTNYIELLRGYVINLDKFDRASEARSFMAEVGIKDVEGALEFLIKAGNWKEDEDPLLKRLGVDGKFPKKATEETKKIIEEPDPEEGVEDLTALEAYSIDDETTEDIDDAISIEETPEGIRVGVHIACVASFIPKWSSLDEEALKRGETIYLPEGHIHMFPKELIKSKLSLFENSPKIALSLLVLFDEKFNIKNYRFTKSRIIVRKNLNYTDAEGFFRKTPRGQKLIDLALSLRKKRVDAGAFIVELPQLKIRLDENGKIVVKKIYMNTLAHIFVSEFMILMNWLSGKFLKERRIPGVFRSQSEPISEDSKVLDENDPLFPLRAVKFLKPVRIGLSPEPHLSMGLDVYVQVTSPIRRYFDLVLHRQILGELSGEGPQYTEEDLERIYMQLEMGIREKKVIQRARERYWLLKYLKELEGKEVKGVISFINERGASVYVPDYLLELPVSITSNTIINEEDEIGVTIQNVDPLRRKISLVPKLS